MAGEEVTDLTEDGSSGDGKKDKKKGKEPKEPKAPKEPKDSKEKKDKIPKPKKSGSGGGVVLVMVIIALLLGGTFGGALYFDLFSSRAIMADLVRDPMLDFLIWLDPRTYSIYDRITDLQQTRDEQIDEREVAVVELEEDIKLREELLETREQQLDRREIELRNLEEELRGIYERAVPLYRREMSPEELEDMQSVADRYTQMAPEIAAEIIARLYTVEDAASILYYMGNRSSAAILAVLDPGFAAGITNTWLYS